MHRESSPEPFFFGATDAPLFGAYHQPHGHGGSARIGVVVCYPLGQEYVRAHAALAALATRLARAGFHVLRFDYSGSGDSHGEQVEFSTCARDIALAVEELRAGAAVTRVWLLGLRLGATLAAITAEASGADGVVLWEPIVDGQRHVELLRSLQAHWAEAQSEPRGRSSASGEEVLGFWFTHALFREIGAIDLLRLVRPRARSLLLLTESSEGALMDELEHAWSMGHPRPALLRRAIPSGQFWHKAEDKKGGLIPVRALDMIVESLRQLIAVDRSETQELR